MRLCWNSQTQVVPKIRKWTCVDKAGKGMQDIRYRTARDSMQRLGEQVVSLCCQPERARRWVVGAPLISAWLVERGRARAARGRPAAKKICGSKRLTGEGRTKYLPLTYMYYY